ncbi:MAG: hypothetical protein JNJ76_14715 [Candidatus Competibacter sp.]|nr:hypothetical protein [Candidatus Competibacter sp.]
MANAYKYLNPGKDGADYVKPYGDMFKKQAEYNKQFINGLDKYYSSPAWGENQPNNFFYIHGGAHYVDANPNMADFPHIVVGFQLYLKYDRTALKILQALLDNQGEVDPTTATWKNAPGGWGDSGPDNYFDLSPDHYVDTNEVIVPVGHVVTGAQLYKKNNRIAIKLYSKPYDQDTRQLAPDYRTETEFSDMNGNYFTIREKGFNFVNSNMVQPNPLSFVTGAQLYPYGNRIALKQRTAYYKPE